MKERERHRLAFERYVAMGAARSLTRLAEELHVSESAVKQWSRAFGWADRLERRNRDIADAVASESSEGAAAELERDQQMVRLALMHTAKAIVEGRVKPTMGDLDRLLRLKRDLAEERQGTGDLECRVEWSAPPATADPPEPSIADLREDLRAEVESLEGSTAAGGAARCSGGRGN